MKAWIKRVLGSRDEPQINPELNALDNYVIVSREELDRILAELKAYRGLKLNTDARELDMMVADLEQENKKLRLDIQILTSALRDATRPG